MNEDVEAAKKNIKKILRNVVENLQWHENLQYTLLGRCTTIKTSTRETPKP